MSIIMPSLSTAPDASRPCLPRALPLGLGRTAVMTMEGVIQYV